jgi:CubicO group peptidase (beta-lactamase class C family)
VRRLSVRAALALALWAIASAAAASCAEPALIGDGWEKSTPQAEGFDADALCAVLDEADRGGDNIHAIVVERHGRLVAELYRSGRDRTMSSPFARDVQFGPTVKHDMRSVSKSVIGLLVGIARGEGRIPGVETPVLSFYPRDEDLRTAGRAAITIGNLLTMSSGLQWSEGVTTYGTAANDETHLFRASTPYRYVLDRPMAAKPGERYNYSGGDTTVLADILARSTNTELRDLVRAKLFAPLGIDDWEWSTDTYGRAVPFAGLRLRPRDLAKIGRMLLDQGQWRGRQIVPADWVAASLAPHIPIEGNLQYGYQWWIGRVPWQGKAQQWSAAFGNGGQRLFMVPSLDLSVTITAGEYNSAQIGRRLAGLLARIVATVGK